MEKLKALFIKYYDILVYLIFGVLTTVVNYLVYLPCYNILGLSSSVSNVIAWAVAVVFAFVTNKPLVFRSHDWSAGVVVPELIKFVGTRIGSGGLETLILLLAVDVLGMNGNVWKLITSVLVVILNYVGSKLLVFRKK
jgi:putative flippase GtrA